MPGFIQVRGLGITAVVCLIEGDYVMNKTTDFPVQIVFRKMRPFNAVGEYIHKRAEKLTQYYDHIMSCHVLVEIINRNHHQGKLFHICIDLNVPNMKLLVSRCSADNHAHEDVLVSLRDAFNALQRRLQTFTRKQRGSKKCHKVPPHGRILKILPEANHGFIESSDGRNIYFTSNSLVNGSFNKLHPGDEVRFVEAANETGKPSASTVRIIGKHHIG